MSRIKDNYQRVQEKIAKAAGRAGRSAADILLCVISKNRSEREITEVAELGHRLFGENRVQEARGKIPNLPPELEWHLVGHLQTNKAKQALELFSMIQSVDSLRVAQALDKYAGRENMELPILIEVNVSSEESKFGISPQRTVDLLNDISKLKRLKIMGLMTMAPYLAEAEETRPYFRQLRELSNEVKKQGLPGVEMRYLSMGMTNDYEIAIEEGANLLRIGSAIFED